MIHNESWNEMKWNGCRKIWIIILQLSISELLGFVGVGSVETRSGFHKDSKEFIFPLPEERDYLKKLPTKQIPCNEL